MYDGEANLLYYVLENDEIVEKSIPTFALEKSITRQEYLVAYQTGTSSVYSFEVASEDYEATRHIDPDTKKPMYASRLEIEGAKYDIKRHYSVGSQKVQLTCS